LKLDENLGRRGADLLRRADHDVATVAEQELRSSSDARLIDICRPPSKPTPEHLRILFETLIAGLAEAQVSGQLWIIEIGRIRKYQEEEE
jgi:hypothetical protein